MTPVRQTVFGAKRGQVTAFIVTAAGLHVDIESGPYSVLLAQIRANKPLLITAEGANVVYAWSDNNSGETLNVAATGMTLSGMVCFAGVNPDMLQMAPRTSKGLVLATVGTAIIRIWSGEA